MVNPNHSVSHGTTPPCSDGEAGKRRPVHPPISVMAGNTGGDFIEYGHSENILGSLVGNHCLPSLGFTFFGGSLDIQPKTTVFPTATYS